jgi:hypothetical protein
VGNGGNSDFVVNKVLFGFHKKAAPLFSDQLSPHEPAI